SSNVLARHHLKLKLRRSDTQTRTILHFSGSTVDIGHLSPAPPKPRHCYISSPTMFDLNPPRGNVDEVVPAYTLL
ncbi:hypothetical protein AAF712_015436, partial [Marasmius tenuissimus]